MKRGKINHHCRTRCRGRTSSDVPGTFWNSSRLLSSRDSAILLFSGSYDSSTKSELISSLTCPNSFFFCHKNSVFFLLQTQLELISVPTVRFFQRREIRRFKKN
jgi:hypothetical protein